MIPKEEKLLGKHTYLLKPNWPITLLCVKHLILIPNDLFKIHPLRINPDYRSNHHLQTVLVDIPQLFSFEESPKFFHVFSLL